jgi:hypothetical protein
VIQDPVDGDIDDGGSWYNPDWTLTDHWVNELKTGNLVFELTFLGLKDTQAFQDALDYISRHWYDYNQDPGWRGDFGYDDDGDGLFDEDPYEWPSVDNDGDGLFSEDPGYHACYQAMYCLMKGFEYSQLELIDLDGDTVPEHDWYAEFAQQLIDEQQAGGYWTGSPWGNDILDTCWALLTLERVIPPPPTIKVSVDVKPGSWPNPFNKDAKGVFSVAICGTEEFDVTTIDPASVKMYFHEIDEEGDCAAPIRWNYEDVATPYLPPNPDDPEGWAEHKDGYVDLVFKFSREEVTGLMTCNEQDMSYWKLYLMGNLKEEFDGTPLEGFDWIRVQMSKGQGNGKGKGKGN